MRQTPESLSGYLGSDSLRLAEAGNLAAVLRENYDRLDNDKDRQAWLEALIFFCVEMDAAVKLRSAGIDSDEKEKLRRLLDVWGEV
jgi:hypothetical protein